MASVEVRARPLLFELVSKSTKDLWRSFPGKIKNPNKHTLIDEILKNQEKISFEDLLRGLSLEQLLLIYELYGLKVYFEFTEEDDRKDLIKAILTNRSIMPEEVYERDKLHAMKLKDLQRLAKDLGIKWKGLKKKDLAELVFRDQPYEYREDEEDEIL